MKKSIEELISNLTIGNRLSTQEFERSLANLDIQLSTDYLDFLKKFNGCEGALGDGGISLYGAWMY